MSNKNSNLTHDTSKLVDTIKPVLATEEVSAKLSFWQGLRLYLVKGGVALKHRNYRLFWTGQLVSLIGTWMQNLAQVWLVLKLTNNDPFALGVVSALQFLPVMLFSVFTGVLADRYPKRSMLLVTQTSSMLFALILAVLTTTGWIQLWEIYVLAACLGFANAMDVPARQAFVPEMVGKEDLMNAVALNSSIFNAARFVGPALAGLIIGLAENLLGSTLAGVALTFWLNGLSYIGVIYGLFLMRTSEFQSMPPKNQPGSILKNLKEGFGYIYRTSQIRSLILLVGIMGTFGVNYNVWIPVLSRTYLHVGAEGYGVLMAALGLGALFMALTIAVQGRRLTQRRVLAMVLLFGLCEIGAAWSEWYLVSLIFMVGIGISSISVFTSSNTAIQEAAPDALRGRVMGVYILVFAGTTPIGSLLMGWLASWGGTPFSMTVGGLLSVSAIPLFWLSWSKSTDSTASLG